MHDQARRFYSYWGQGQGHNSSPPSIPSWIAPILIPSPRCCPPSCCQILALQDTSDSGPMSDADRRLAAVTEEALSRCCFEDIFTDSKFLKQGEESAPGGGSVP